ncbi:MAG TPA: hypothetical protein PLF40_20995 [Kofleriaceae bacterium]|nr:hypothetical protein [Kofleriaceae bacterium]
MKVAHWHVVLAFVIVAGLTAVYATDQVPEEGVTLEAAADISVQAADAAAGAGVISLSAGISAPAVPVTSRWGICDDELGDQACFWIFTGVDEVDRDFVRATARGSWVGAAGTAPTATFEESVTGRFHGAQIEHRLQWQRQAGLNDTFWRSGRGLLNLHHEFTVPAAWSFGSKAWRLSAFGAVIALGKWYAPSQGGWASNAWDRRIVLQGVTSQSSGLRVTVADGEFFSAGVPLSQVGTIQTGRSVDVFSLDGLAVTYSNGRHRLHFNGGASVLFPISDYVRDVGSETSVGNSTITPRVKAGYQFGDFGSPTDFALHIDGGTWSRISPSGVGADVGYAGSLGVQAARRGYTLHLESQFGKARRAVQGVVTPAQAMETTALRVGDTFWFARGDATLSKPLPHGLTGALQLWAERSDRDNPQQGQITDGNFRFATGAQASLGWSWATLK